MHTTRQNRQLLAVMFLYSFAALAAGLLCGDLPASLSGLLTILTSPAQLTLDYFKIGTVGGTFLNVGLVGLSCALVFALSGASLSGASFIGFFLSYGFGFFGMNALNIWPCILGTWLYARAARKPFASQANFAIFSTAIAPLISEMLFRYPAPAALRPVLALAVGAAGGFLTPILCGYMPALHKGYTLYNAAPAEGFIAIMLVGVLYRSMGVEIPTNTSLGDSQALAVNAFAVGTSLCALAAGFVMNGKSLAGYGKILRSSSYKCDFTQEHGPALTLVNIGVFGLFITAYYNLIGAKMTGPTAGAIFCWLACTAIGGHVVTMLPIMVGYALAALVSAITLDTQAIVVGLCFAACLCPVSGRFGAVCGAAAGMLHAFIVTTVMTFHSSFCLYNGGFTGCITLLILLPVLEAFFEPQSELHLLPRRRQ